MCTNINSIYGTNNIVPLFAVTGEQFHYLTTNVGEQALLDLAASGIWGGQFEHTFIDVRVFNPYASSNHTTSLASSYARQEREKRSYEQWIREIEHAAFIPAVFATTGGMGRHATSLYKRIASLLSEKTAEPYNTVMATLPNESHLAAIKHQVHTRLS